MDIIFSYGVGYIFSCVIGHIFINLLWAELWRVAGRQIVPRFAIYPMMTGFIERFLFTTAWLADKPEFIAVWLVLKIGGQWWTWTGVTASKTEGSKKGIRPTYFNILLIGTSLSVIYGVVGGMTVDWVKTGQREGALAIGGLVLTTGIFSLWAKRVADRNTQNFAAQVDHATYIPVKPLYQPTPPPIEPSIPTKASHRMTAIYILIGITLLVICWALIYRRSRA